MQNNASLTSDNDTLTIDGEVDFANVVALRDQGDQWLRTAAPQQCRLDLGKITRCNSAATTLLLSWLRTAESLDKTLTIKNVPPALRSLMVLGGLEMLLPVE